VYFFQRFVTIQLHTKKKKVKLALKSENKTAKCKDCVAEALKSSEQSTNNDKSNAVAAPGVEIKTDWYTTIVEAGEPLKCSQCEKGL
jgi:hypothetical protein